MWAVLVFAFYLICYTAYNKSQKNIDINLLLDVLLLRRSGDFTLVELNKVFGLTGLTLLGLSYLLHKDGDDAVYFLWAHWGLSIFKFYGSSKLPSIDGWMSLPSDLMKGRNKNESWKKLSVIFGAIAQLLLLLSYMKRVNQFYGVFMAMVFGLLHFFTMETDTNLKLTIRPAAYVAFIVPLFALMHYFWSK
jgi:hypothetical protein